MAPDDSGRHSQKETSGESASLVAIRRACIGAISALWPRTLHKVGFPPPQPNSAQDPLADCAAILQPQII